LLRRNHHLLSTRLACITHAIGSVIVGIFCGSMAGIFALFQGASDGTLTIAFSTLLLAIFGSKGYGYCLGGLFRYIPATDSDAFRPHRQPWRACDFDPSRRQDIDISFESVMSAFV